MKEKFDLRKIRSIEFGLCYHFNKGREQAREYVLVPVDSGVQDALKKMLKTTLLKLSDGKLKKYEFSQRYPPIDRLKIALAKRPLKTLRAFYETENIAINAGRIRDIKNLFFYFATFRDDRKNKWVGVRRTTQFRGVVSTKSCLIRLADDILTLVEDNIFKLNDDFDYLISPDAVYVLRPTGFERTADVQTYINKCAKDVATNLGREGTSVNFPALAKYASEHPRAGRLVFSVSSRGDSGDISLTRLKKLCKENEIEFVVKNGKIQPQPGYQMAFLELLDRRRYIVSLHADTNLNPEYYRAQNREQLFRSKKGSKDSSKVGLN